ncbi:MAG: GTPase HflX [Bacillaceae bacterium]|nr:GTPase HflX [Bacillaceae bacterium]
MKEVNVSTEEKVIIVGCKSVEVDEHQFKYSLEELASLVKTAGGVVVCSVTQNRHQVDKATYIGRGKVEEIEVLVDELDVDVVIFNDELSTSQMRNLNDRLNARIIDRTQLVLDIFSQRARSKEGKLQVELAQLNYLLPRLTGQGHSLSRLGGGIGTRGPGETQLETDRRHIRRRMDEIKDQLKRIVKHRDLYRERRKDKKAFQIALVGYTNAGKSTLLNRLAKADVFEEDLLFATLDPVTRKLKLPSGFHVLLTDTVGFIQDLPTTLVAAFRSTLEELTEADLLLHVVDSSSHDYFNHEKTVTKLLDELKASDIPMLTVYNKSDVSVREFVPTEGSTSMLISAFNEADLAALRKKIEQLIMEKMTHFQASIPASEGKLIARCKQEAIVERKIWDEEEEVYDVSGTLITNLLYTKI